ncbi:hypothetical protein M0R88_14460 [Halorussus gelatinilyticus]|uniref:Lipoprotein n=1 Tax=Halorussus gelatinilyticus TaxID=2937524 RepID=A0A8U0IF63_9EURY|nr:hypothetical protein [Halorussus gelatinilyticus]UPV99709.1 hypothetical protein M0R88_14460 [Halorussus gelatinilyticus]
MSPPASRPRHRCAAAWLCLALLVGLAGCSAALAPGTDDARPPALEEIRIENHDTTDRAVSVLVVENGSVVRWEEFHLDARSTGDELDAATLDAGEMNGPHGEYAVYVRAGNTTRRADLSDGRVGSLATDCTEQGGRVRLEFTVAESGTVTRKLGCE